MKKVFLNLLFAGILGSTVLLAQTPTAPVFPQIPLPSSISAFGEFNQLGSPKTTLGLSGFFPVNGSVGIYSITTADVSPALETDPTTGKKFYAVSAALRTGLLKDVLDTGRFSFLLGGDLGPSLGTTTAGGTTLNFSTSVQVQAVYQVSPLLVLWYL